MVTIQAITPRRPVTHTSARSPDATDVVLTQCCEPGADVQLLLSGTVLAARHNVLPELFAALWRGCAENGYSVGRPIVVHRWQPETTASIGALLHPAAVIALVDDRTRRTAQGPPSAYVVDRPGTDHGGSTHRIDTLGSGIQVAQRLLATLGTMIGTPRTAPYPP